MGALQDKVALVTGASSGLGAETARLLSQQGATVFGIGRDGQRLADVFAGVEHGAYSSVEVASSQACSDAVEQCVREFGGLDVLVNIAGRHQMRRTETMTDDDWAQDLAVNLNGPFYLCRAALPHLLERGGSIVNVSSIAGVEGQAGRVPPSGVNLPAFRLRLCGFSTMPWEPLVWQLFHARGLPRRWLFRIPTESACATWT